MREFAVKRSGIEERLGRVGHNGQEADLEVLGGGGERDLATVVL